VESATFPAHFQATVYEVQLPTNHLEMLDARKLATRAGKADDLLRALAAAGSARTLYRVDQPVNVYAEKIMVGSSEPVVSAVRSTAAGAPIRSVTHADVGFILSLSAQPSAAGSGKHPSPEVVLDIRLATLGSGGPELAQGVKASPARTVSIQHREQLEFGRPRVMLSVDTSKEDAPPVAYVIRYLFSEP